MKKNHHPLLFSKYFKYLWRLVFFASFYTRSFKNMKFYGSHKKGFYIVCNNGITFKVIPAENFKNKSTYAYSKSFFIYTYYNGSFIMKHASIYSINHSFDNNPFISCQTEDDIKYVIKSLSKIFWDTSILEESYDANIESINFSNFIHSNSSMGLVAKSTYNGHYQAYTGVFILEDKHYLVKEDYLVYIYNDLKDMLGSDSAIVLKISEYLSYCSYAIIHRLYDYDSGIFVGIVVNLHGQFSSNMDVYLFNDNDFVYKELRYGCLGDIKIAHHKQQYGSNKLNSIFTHLLEIVKIELIRNPSKRFYEKADDLGLDFNNKQKLTVEMFEVFEMLNY